MTNVFELHIIELPKIKRLLKKIRISDEEKELAKWIKFLTNPEELGELDMCENEELKKAKEEFDDIQNDEYEQRMAELRMKHIMDTKAIEEYGYENGLKDGIEQGKELLKNEKLKIAKKLLEQGNSVEEVIKITDLIKEDIETLYIESVSKLKENMLEAGKE